MLIHLLVIGTIIFLFTSVQWLSQRAKLKKQDHPSSKTFEQKQEAAA